MKRWLIICWAMMWLMILAGVGEAAGIPQNTKDPNPYGFETVRPNDPVPSLVKALQYLLIAQGYQLEAGGHYGPLTIQRVKEFQRAHHLKQTGNANIETWEALIVPLQRGSKGPAVKAAQVLLRDRPTGLLDAPKVSTDIYDAAKRSYKLPLDGIFGERMERVIKQFKRDVHSDIIVNARDGSMSHKAQVSGLIGPRTWGYLLFGEPAGESASVRDE